MVVLAHCVARAFVYHARQALVLELPELEQRLSNLQSQVERLWRKAETSVPPIEQRLAAMADQYAEYLKRWAATVERHTNAVSQLEAYASEWKDASTRVRQETADRLQELETTIEREWDTLKKMQEEPIRELREQAESLTQVSLAMANASQQGVERAEARFAAFETEVHIRLTELTRELTTALAEMKARLDRQPASRDAVLAVVAGRGDAAARAASRRHTATGQFPHTIDHDSVTGPRELPAAAAVDSTDRRAVGAHPDRRPARCRPVGTGRLPEKWVAAAALLGLAVVVAGVFGWRLQGQIKAATDRAAIAEKKADVAVSDGFRQAEAAREEAAKQTADAREMAGRLQRIGNVMAAPDLIRFNLVRRQWRLRSSALQPVPRARRQWLRPSITAGERVVCRLAGHAVRASQDGTADRRAGWNGHAGPAGAERTARRWRDGDVGSRGRRGRSVWRVPSSAAWCRKLSRKSDRPTRDSDSLHLSDRMSR